MFKIPKLNTVPEQRKLFLLDAYALIYRAYYALMRAPRVTSSGLNTSAIFGFCNTLEDVLRKENPGYMAVCFDPPHGRTFRHEKYPEYKEGRDKQPEDITIAIPYIKRILNAFRIPVIEVDGYEADDVIGTLSVKARAEGFVTYMMTLDKDYGQLVNDDVLWYRPALKGNGFEIRGPKEVCEFFNVDRPEQVIDLLAIEGDKSDHVPGCPGIGEVGAVKLVRQFGSVERMLAEPQLIEGANRKKVESNIDTIRLSKWLVTIKTDVPLEVEPDDLVRREPDVPELVKIFKELEFKSFIVKYGLTPEDVVAAPPAPAAPDLFDLADAEQSQLDPVPEAVTVIPESTPVLTDPAEIAKFLEAAARSRYVGLSTVAAGAEAMTAHLAGMALAFEPDAVQPDTLDGRLVFDDPEPAQAYIKLPDDTARRQELMVALQPLFSQPEVTIVSADVKRDMLLLRNEKVEFAGARYFDLAVAHYMCNPEAKHDLEDLAFTYLGRRMPLYSLPSNRRDSVLVGMGEQMAPIAGGRAAAGLQLRPLLLKEAQLKGQLKLLEEIEMPLVEVLADMEWEGARIEAAELNRLEQDLARRLQTLEKEAYDIAGHPFNVGSPTQVGTVLFDELKIDPKARKTKGGAWSTAEDVLEKYAHQVPLVKLILDIRGLRKLLATYVQALPKLVNPRTGKLHTTYRQTVTSTGRISSTNPNLQNIPVRTDDGREIRRAFVADPGDLLLSADYSQIELRLMADLSGDTEMIEAFRNGQDIHRATAAKIYHLDPADVTPDQRRNAKTANFGIIYGISAFGLSERLGIPRAEAKELIEGYLATYPAVAQYMQKSIERARENGYVTTIMGRRRYLPDIASRSNTVRAYAERNAINAPLQGSAADIIKLAMVRIHAEIRRRGLRSRMILQVHDELIFNVKPDEAAQLQTLVADLMEGAYTGRVPMEVSSGLAPNWLDAH